jgi:hypothetical protein
MVIIHATKDSTPLVNFAASCRSNRVQLYFSSFGRAATYGTAGSVNASVEIAGFDFSGTARYRTVSERYFGKRDNDCYTALQA